MRDDLHRACDLTQLDVVTISDEAAALVVTGIYDIADVAIKGQPHLRISTHCHDPATQRTAIVVAGNSCQFAQTHQRPTTFAGCRDEVLAFVP
ncbi:hypothetical protein CK240_11555 [Paracoccus salipaludis]|uniref:Uncharacterized protein n=1 Tax=Paracoccus salipaludis TaxID=2032623 RepID=A0A2A2GJ51_9RHOB|nr:hypothetical protein CK240_11555 [Paracoccus salipaludis]